MSYNCKQYYSYTQIYLQKKYFYILITTTSIQLNPVNVILNVKSFRKQSVRHLIKNNKTIIMKVVKSKYFEYLNYRLTRFVSKQNSVSVFGTFSKLTTPIYVNSNLLLLKKTTSIVLTVICCKTQFSNFHIKKRREKKTVQLQLLLLLLLLCEHWTDNVCH